MENQRMLGTQEAVDGGTEGGPGPTGVLPTTAAAAHARHPERFVQGCRGRLRRQRKSGSTQPKIGQQAAHLNYPAKLNSFRSCLKVIDTFRSMDNHGLL